MSVTIEDVKRIACLARIRMDDSEIESVRSDLNGIVGFVEQLREVDCSAVDDGAQCVGGACVADAHEREDIAEPCSPLVMDNAPQKECNMFVVPKVVG